MPIASCKLGKFDPNSQVHFGRGCGYGSPLVGQAKQSLPARFLRMHSPNGISSQNKRVATLGPNRPGENYSKYSKTDRRNNSDRGSAQYVYMLMYTYLCTQKKKLTAGREKLDPGSQSELIKYRRYVRSISSMLSTCFCTRCPFFSCCGV